MSRSFAKLTCSACHWARVLVMTNSL